MWLFKLTVKAWALYVLISKERLMKHINILIFFLFWSSHLLASSNASEKACTDGRCENQIKQIKLLAKNGSPRAQYLLGIIYREGDGISKDLKQSFRWTKRSANQKFGFAQYELALMYLKGTGTKTSQSKYQKYLAKAIDKGVVKAVYHKAMVELSTLKNKEISALKDPKRSIILANSIKLLESISAKYPLADFRLAQLYEEGYWVKRDIFKSLQHYKVASSKQIGNSTGKIVELRKMIAESPQLQREMLQVDSALQSNDSVIVVSEERPEANELLDYSISSIKSTGAFDGNKTGSRIHRCTARINCSVYRFDEFGNIIP